VLYGSTIWVYSDCEEIAVDEATATPPPKHPYSATKLAGELYCRSYASFFGLESTILRFGIPYGPRARGATVLAAFVSRARDGEPLTIAGSGEQSRRFIYVEDLAHGIVKALRPEAANRIYNLAGTEETTILQVAEAVRDTVGGTEIVHTPARSGDFGGKQVSSERAAQELEWTPETSFDEGVRRYVSWYLNGRSEIPASAAEVAGRQSAAAAQAENDGRRRVLILSADIGEGHDGPARAVAADIAAEEPEARVEVIDGLAAMGRLLQWLIRDGSWFAFNWFPWLFEVQYFLIAHFPPTRWLGGKLSYWLSRRKMLNLIEERQPSLIVSTYPGTTAVLGELRRTDRLDIPTVSVITDLAGLRFWAHPGIDLHTVTHRESVEEVARIAGNGSVRWAAPPTAAGFLEPRDRDAARRELGLPADGAVVMVSGGGWGIGDLEGATREALARPETTVVCISGRNERVHRRLSKRFGHEPRLRLIEFTDRMSDYLAAADVLIHSTAGLTVLEAQIRGTQVISYGFHVGHVRANDKAYQRTGLARVALSRRQLRAELPEALADPRWPDDSFARLPSVADFSLETKARAKPLPAWRRRTSRAAVSLALTAGFTGWLMGTGTPYAMLAGALHARPATAFTTAQPDVALLVSAPSGETSMVARTLAKHGARASFEMQSAPTHSTLTVLRHYGDEGVPALKSGAWVRWVKTRSQLDHTAEGLGLRSGYVYAVPDSGFSLGQYVLARTTGGSPVAAAESYDGGSLNPDSLKPGQVVELELDGSIGSAKMIDELLGQLDKAGLNAVSIGILRGGGNGAT
jgi:UDP-N-acetylglucosamine:LPS N-acetylglucosamine transferase